MFKWIVQAVCGKRLQKGKCGSREMVMMVWVKVEVVEKGRLDGFGAIN